jgi:cell division transport system ATP-binding protein
VGLAHKEKHYPDSLSGGEQQRINIARAVIHKPKLILADEPTGNLDPQLSSEIMHLFSQFNELGVSVLIATHDINLIEALPYRKLSLEHGELIDDGYQHEANI